MTAWENAQETVYSMNAQGGFSSGWILPISVVFLPIIAAPLLAILAGIRHFVSIPLYDAFIVLLLFFGNSLLLFLLIFVFLFLGIRLYQGAAGQIIGYGLLFLGNRILLAHAPKRSGRRATG